MISHSKRKCARNVETKNRMADKMYAEAPRIICKEETTPTFRLWKKKKEKKRNWSEKPNEGQQECHEIESTNVSLLFNFACPVYSFSREPCRSSKSRWTSIQRYENTGKVFRSWTLSSNSNMPSSVAMYLLESQSKWGVLVGSQLTVFCHQRQSLRLRWHQALRHQGRG